MRKSLDTIENALHAIGCSCLAVMAMLIACDAVIRATTGSPLSFQFELTEMYLMPAVATLSLPYVYRHGGHIGLDIINDSLLGRASKPIHLLFCILAAAFFAAFAWRSGDFAYSAWMRNDIYMGVIDWPMYLAYLSTPLGTGFLALRLLVNSTSKQPEAGHG